MNVPSEDNGKVLTKTLQGAGTVEQILAKMMNNSIMMKMNLVKPEFLSFFAKEFYLEDNEIDILQSNAKVKRSENDKTFFLTIDALNFQMTFWMGFDDVKDAEKMRTKMNL